MTEVIEWFGCITGVLGAAMLAANNRWSGYGFVLFLISNVAWIGFGIMSHAYGLVSMQGVFTITSVIGIWQWIIQPKLADRRKLVVWNGR
ncbi:MAG: hypothetical protein COW70_10945 [Hydrogenophilales bacterium CG18_big_fil_WC_8_21_14_2_50_58_12]|nr:MAG: hypothetical protein COW70_10945 [Hydrogenophilales bacterium CG18_big_fil_WC_8_21_14_2_50_58_12]